MKKMIGLAMWLVAFLLPFRFAILDTDDLVQPDGTINNIKGLLSFVAMVALLFAGYAMVDSSKKQDTGGAAHGH